MIFTETFTLTMIAVAAIAGTASVVKRRSIRLPSVKICPWKLAVVALAAGTIGMFFGPY